MVYPAGFLYVYSAIQYVTGGEVYPAQVSWFNLVFMRNFEFLQASITDSFDARGRKFASGMETVLNECIIYTNV